MHFERTEVPCKNICETKIQNVKNQKSNFQFIFKTDGVQSGEMILTFVRFLLLTAIILCSSETLANLQEPGI